MKESDNITTAEDAPQEAVLVKCEPCNGHGYKFEMGWIPTQVDHRCRVCDGRGVVAK